MAKYQEVRDKQKHVEEVEEVDKPMSRGIWVGFTFGKNGPNAKALSAMGGSDDSGELATIF
jgi:cell cycle protein kinase DBF2